MTSVRKPSKFGRLVQGASVLVAGVSLAASGLFLKEAYALAQVEDPPVDRSILDPYEKEQTRWLEERGPADDLALGGEKGKSQIAKELGFVRRPVEETMPEVVSELESGAYAAHTLSPEQEKMIEKIALGGVGEEDIVAALDSDEMLAKGQEIFAANCAACHLASGAGQVGPNLTDEYVIHGHEPIDTYKVINQGVLSAGMPAWNHLGTEKMVAVSAYALSLRGKNIEGKAPQGVNPAGEPAPE